MATQNINFANVKDFVFNGVNQGFSKIELDGVRRWEKYQTTEQYQEWVESGYNQETTTWVGGITGTFSKPSFTEWVYNVWRFRWLPNAGYVTHASRSTTLVFQGVTYRVGAYIGGYGGPNGQSPVHGMEKKVVSNNWIDTSTWVDKTRQITAYYY